MKRLTGRQRQVLESITTYISQNGYPPTFRELMELNCIGTPNGIMCHLKALERAGFILRKHGSPRAITLIQQPAEEAEAS